MAENFDDYGNYSNELEYEKKSKLGKIFSWRTPGKILKVLGLSLIVFVYGILFFRLLTGSAPKSLSGILWTEGVYAYYEANGENTVVYTQEPVQNVADDGYFGVFDVLYFPEIGELQMTIRYNNSTVEALRRQRVKEAEKVLLDEIKERLRAEQPSISEKVLKTNAEAELAVMLTESPITINLSEQPFVFLLRDDSGRVYSSYQYIAGEKTVYQYVRASFSGVNLLGTESIAPAKGYPTASAPVADYLYKGINAAESDAVTYLYLDMYDEKAFSQDGESFAYPLQVYHSTEDLTSYRIKKTPVGVTEGITEVSLVDTAHQAD